MDSAARLLQGCRVHHVSQNPEQVAFTVLANIVRLTEGDFYYVDRTTVMARHLPRRLAPPRFPTSFQAIPAAREAGVFAQLSRYESVNRRVQ